MKFIQSACLLGTTIVCGCGGPTPARPGTVGTIHAGNQPIANVRVAFHRRGDDKSQPLGFGLSDHEGKFKLYLENAVGPLWLEPAEYAVTLESEGPEPFSWPTEYIDPHKTPLIVVRTGNEELRLEVPEPISLGAGRRLPSR